MCVHTYVCFTISASAGIVVRLGFVLPFSSLPPCPVSARQSQWYASDIDIEVIQYLCLVSVELFIGKDGNFPTKSKNFPFKAKLFDCLPFLRKREDWRDDQRIFHSECLTGEKSGVGRSWQRIVLVVFHWQQWKYPFFSKLGEINLERPVVTSIVLSPGQRCYHTWSAHRK